VLLLLSVVLIAIVGLIPGQDANALGAELLGLGLVLGGAIATLAIRSLANLQQSRPWRIARLVLLAAGTLPVLLGGASLVAAAGGGLYWVAAGIVFAIVGGVGNAWVLLVEILR
jgi:hypothetical protein